MPEQGSTPHANNMMLAAADGVREEPLLRPHQPRPGGILGVAAHWQYCTAPFGHWLEYMPGLFLRVYIFTSIQSAATNLNSILL